MSEMMDHAPQLALIGEQLPAEVRREASNVSSQITSRSSKLPCANTSTFKLASLIS
ncbi:MAG: hypothetical protein ACTS4U_02045 [Candidatus Hodgkinia cicadicola]